MSKSPPRNNPSKIKPAPTGIAEVDRLADLPSCTIQDYVTGVSAYIRQQGKIASGPKKAGQIRLSNALARALAEELEKQLPMLRGRLVTQETKVAGGLRTQTRTCLKAIFSTACV